MHPFGVIRPAFPEKNKYTNLFNVKSKLFSQLDDSVVDDLVKFISLNYLNNGDNKYSPTRENFDAHFSCASESIVTVYTENPFKPIGVSENLKSVITSRPVNIVLNADSAPINFIAQYVDFLCVDKTRRKSGIAPQMIQTHYYNQRQLLSNADNAVACVFKREGVLTGIVPLCAYTSYAFRIPSEIATHKLCGHSLVRITQQSVYKVYDFLKYCGTEKLFSVTIQSSESTVCELIKTHNVFIDVMINLTTDQIVCAYFFRKSCTFIRDSNEVLSCFASIKLSGASTELFVDGFNQSLSGAPTQYTILDIEDISHNHHIIRRLEPMLEPAECATSPTAYFFYNYAYPTSPSRKMLIII